MKITLPAITPGKYHVEKEPNGMTLGIWSGDAVVAEVEIEVDAQAISALPELLDALTRIAYSTSQSTEAFVMREHAKQALLKAGATIED